MNPTRTLLYRCGECHDLHRFKDDAIACCAPDIEKVPSWVCAECGDVSDDEDTARYCCLDEEIILPASPGQLEAAGQKRLAL
jgi:hypothetical protein